MAEKPDVKAAVRERYSRVAEGESCCSGGESAQMRTGQESVVHIGYAPERIAEVPAEVVASNAGCGAPLDHAGARPGEVVLDLGSGAGLDCFLAAREVGERGRVIGLDMTDAMLAKAEKTRRKLGLDNVEFRRGEMEEMPLEDASVDLIISNCVINLSPDKPAAFRESFRVLRPGGRFVVSDVLKAGERKREGSVEEWCACIAGAISEEEYLGGLRAAGFGRAEVLERKPYIAEGLVSATILALKGASG